jgi:hypothetical protein
VVPDSVGRTGHAARQLVRTYDLVFQVYSNVLGIPAEDLPPLVARAVAVDSLIVFAIIGFRRRKKIAAWWRGRQATQSSKILPMDESLSRAP